MTSSNTAYVEMISMSFFVLFLGVLSSFGGLVILISFNFMWFWGVKFLFQNNTDVMMMSDFTMGDSLSGLMSWMVALIVLISYLCSDKDFCVTKDISGFSLSLTSIALVCYGFFISGSMFFFFFFFESSLIPTLFLILGWGYQPERLQAGLFMMLYTVSASMPLFVSLCFVWKLTGSESMVDILMSTSFNLSGFIWFFLTLGFMVKLPIFIVHGWLPKAHVEAPVSGSMVLAGILLKLGGYGLFRILTVLVFTGSKIISFTFVVSIWGGLLCSVFCLTHSDMKALIAYSSIGHMSLVLGGVLSFFQTGWMGGICLMFAHGLCSPCMFSLANLTYGYFNSRSVMICKGILKIFPMVSFSWFLILVINMGCPPSINFLSEVFLIGSVMMSGDSFIYVLSGMCFITAGYCLYLYCSINHGTSSLGLLGMPVSGERCLGFVVSCGFFLFILVINLELFFVL